MNKLLYVFLMVIIFSFSSVAQAQRYGEKFCKNPDYKCIKIKGRQSWEKLWPNAEQRDIVKRINRLNIALYPGMTIAVPRNLAQLTIYDVSPFPRYIESIGEKIIYVNQKQLAWGAYNSEGELVWWGPLSSGKSFCPDIGESCLTPTGAFHIFRKQGIDCISTEFPRRANGEKGGAIMPFCMHFNGGIALHGSLDVPGYRASHGCVRLFIEDAKWLNEEFIELPGQGSEGTRIIVGELDDDQEQT